MGSVMQIICTIPLMHAPKIPEMLVIKFGGRTPKLTKPLAVPKADAMHL
jgi:hypothetical protein